MSPLVRETVRRVSRPGQSARDAEYVHFVPDSLFDPRTMGIAEPSAKQLAELQDYCPGEYAGGQYVGRWAEKPEPSAPQSEAERIAGLTVSEMEQAIAETQDIDLLAEVAAIEAAGQQRKTALEALDARLAEIAGGGEDDE